MPGRNEWVDSSSSSGSSNESPGDFTRIRLVVLLSVFVVFVVLLGFGYEAGVAVVVLGALGATAVRIAQWVIRGADSAPERDSDS
jgi:hypothetical protein